MAKFIKRCISGKQNIKIIEDTLNNFPEIKKKMDFEKFKSIKSVEEIDEVKKIKIKNFKI
jgi:hypothetical protein